MQAASPAAVAQATAQASASNRVALVIGNGNYKDAPLLNPVNDARGMVQALKDSGFMVIARENVDQRGMLAALREFGDRLHNSGGSGSVGVFYYAGHGMQIKGRNYLIPVGAPIEREDEVAYSAVDAQAVLDKMEAAGNGTNIMILDACRNNPFARSFRSGQAGLAQMDAPVGTLVSFATSPGNVASDGAGQNGLFTQHLLTAMRQSGAKVEEVFKQVRANVRRDSQGKQVPWEMTSLEGDFYFLPPETKAPLARIEPGIPVAANSVANNQANTPASGRVGSENAVVKRPERPTLASNAFGYTVGDRWRYQLVDKFKAEVVANYAWQVDRIEPNGDVVLNKGAAVWAPEGFLKFTRNAERTRNYAGFTQYPPTLKAGAKTDLRYEIASKFTDGHSFKEISSGTMTVKGQERVRTPAGEFDAWKVETETFWQIQGANSGGRYLQTSWYVPELRRYVAWEEESRNKDGSFNRRDRHELTSYEVASHAAVSVGVRK